MTAIRSARQFHDSGLGSADADPRMDQVLAQYAIGITPMVVDMIRDAGGTGPIARQFIPDPAELHVADIERDDPIGDAPHSPIKGIIHRYPDRVLFKPVHQCAVYCRFCFRREQVGPGKDVLDADEWQRALDYIARTPAIREVILSGGDPLILSPRRLSGLYQFLAHVPHVKIIRIHTRVPVVMPEAITDDLVTALRGKKPVYMTLHTNHADEWTLPVRDAVARLADAGFPLVSQTVLLKGINDNIDALEALMWVLLENRVKPYYLHHGDLARGTSHFRTSITEGMALMRALHVRSSGLSLPHYVLDIPGGHGKIPVNPAHFTLLGPGHWRVTGPDGRQHNYREF